MAGMEDSRIDNNLYKGRPGEWDLEESLRIAGETTC